MKKIFRKGATKPIHDLFPPVTVKVWVDIDAGIVEDVLWLQKIEGVRTFSCCQGTIGEGGAHPYEAQIMAYVPARAKKEVATRFTFGEKGNGWVYLHPKKIEKKEKPTSNTKGKHWNWSKESRQNHPKKISSLKNIEK